MEEKLILEVFNYPELYDPKNKRYHDRHAKENIWQEIGTRISMKGSKNI
jgi:hypothetical protein